MELETRLIFIDTCAFENKNFQFGSHALQTLEELLEYNKIQLLITDITKNEIKSHIIKKSEEAIKELNNYMDEKGKILRAAPELPLNSIFSKTKKQEVYENIISKFEAFLDYPNVETVPINNVNPDIVFEKYFTKQPPFINENKKNEFPDAFVLEAIKAVAQSRMLKIYIISSDKDMLSFAEQNECCIPLQSINELLDLVLRNDKELSQPIEFADSIFERLRNEIFKLTRETLIEAQFEVQLDAPDFYDSIDEVYDIVIDNIDIKNKKLIEVTSENAQYEVEFEVEVTASYLLPDYDNSPWDPEDKVYIFLRNEEVIKSYKQNYLAHIALSFSQGIRSQAEISEFEFEHSVFPLDEENSKLVTINPSYSPYDQ
ncbi:PIN domain-containing protein [Acinetobacter courvalinii]|uniref:PIN domain-containing protein n=1 Tax=Acinetobacter courvalinii TaxID=280147 RepID=UPI0018FF6785|nr:PIN domain-containing protein [Acinetobacter courvalinii]MBJ8417467.1 DUF4935 domain-containing protein [Acinetobacter courvalinii]